MFDLWFVVTRAYERIDKLSMRARAHEIAQAKRMTLPRADTPFNPAHRAILERAWDKALRNTSQRPTLTQVEQDLGQSIQFVTE